MMSIHRSGARLTRDAVERAATGSGTGGARCTACAVAAPVMRVSGAAPACNGKSLRALDFALRPAGAPVPAGASAGAHSREATARRAADGCAPAAHRLQPPPHRLQSATHRVQSTRSPSAIRQVTDCNRRCIDWNRRLTDCNRRRTGRAGPGHRLPPARRGLQSLPAPATAASSSSAIAVARAATGRGGGCTSCLTRRAPSATERARGGAGGHRRLPSRAGAHEGAQPGADPLRAPRTHLTSSRTEAL